jgi:hypothetical protein
MTHIYDSITQSHVTTDDAELEYNGGVAPYEDIADYTPYTPIYGAVVA